MRSQAHGVHREPGSRLLVSEVMYMADHQQADQVRAAEVAGLFDAMAAEDAAIATLERALHSLQESQRAKAALATLTGPELRAGLVYRANRRGKAHR